MRVDVALVEMLGVRLIVAYVHDSWVRPGVGDDLISRLAPHLPPMPIMLVAEAPLLRVYAPFQTDQFKKLLPANNAQRFEVDLTAQPEDEEELPF